jgi:hypothetical protein
LKFEGSKSQRKHIFIPKGVFGSADRLGKESTRDRKFLDKCVSMVWFNVRKERKCVFCGTHGLKVFHPTKGRNMMEYINYKRAIALKHFIIDVIFFL